MVRGEKTGRKNRTEEKTGRNVPPEKKPEGKNRKEKTGRNVPPDARSNGAGKNRTERPPGRAVERGGGARCNFLGLRSQVAGLVLTTRGPGDARETRCFRRRRTNRRRRGASPQPRTNATRRPTAGRWRPSLGRTHASSRCPQEIRAEALQPKRSELWRTPLPSFDCVAAAPNVAIYWKTQRGAWW